MLIEKFIIYMGDLLLSKNRKALFNHLLIESFSAGIVLKGYEVKALREGNVAFEGSFIDIRDGVPFVQNLYIGKYSKQSKEFDEFNARRDRQLLLNKNEIIKLTRELSEKGKTAVPLALIMHNGHIKLEFALVKGKKEYEKKIVVKERQILKDLQRESKELKI